MDKLIPLIVVIVFIYRIAGWFRRQQQEAEKERQRSTAPKTKTTWESETPAEIPISELELMVGAPPERPRVADDEYQTLVDESTIRDEEDIDEENIKEEVLVHTPQPEPVLVESVAPRKRKPVRIAGVPINAKTITQGIIISEVLRRPKF
ncbi:hypothetical protein ACFL6S_27390 [Candidatus Poribacteria bacterium]